jgi:MoaA/NifB/PqqE/SkfB family radical SAM enzyme
MSGAAAASDAVRRGAEWLASVARTRLGRADRPRLLTYIVTFRCNARCVMCDSWRKDGEGEMTLAEIERIYLQLPRLHAVRLTGGEPFVRKDFADVAALTQELLRPAFLHVTTNGFLTDRIVKFCEQRKRTVPLYLLVSIDGVGDKHNEVRGQRNAWDQSVATLRALAPRTDELGIRLAVNQTIVDAEGARHYTKLRDFLRPLGVRNQVVMAYEASATYSLARETNVSPRSPGSFSTFGSFDRHELAALFTEIERDIADYPLPEREAKRYYLDGIRSRLLANGATPNPPCVALGAHLRLFPNGDVPTCQFNTARVGNLATQPFEKVWQSETAERQRRWVRDCPGCWAECEIVPNAIYSGDLLLRKVRRQSGAAL